MYNPKRFLSLFMVVLFVVCFLGSTEAEGACANTSDKPIAEVTIGSNGVNFMPKIGYRELVITLGRADGTIFQKTFGGGSMPYIDAAEIFDGAGLDGTYSYELRAIPAVVHKERESQETAGLLKDDQRPAPHIVQVGSFQVLNGSIVGPSNAQEEISKAMDVLHYDDVIITGSLCVGFDCIDGESFGYCTQKYKENNLQVCFEDTSTGTFPTTDWKIQINDTSSGGASYFTLWDTTAGIRPFTIEAGAPAHSLYVEDYGRVGLGTSIPYVELHIVDGDSPAIRFDQDGSSGWAAQSWDFCGNETNFFLRDVTNGSKLCFRVQPNTPSNTLCLKSTGYVGIGTWSPEYPLELEVTGDNATFGLHRTDGAIAKIAAGTNAAQFGSDSNHSVKIMVNNSTTAMTINTSGQVGIGITPTHLLHLSGGAYSDGATWQPSCSRMFKENISDLTLDEARTALDGLTPVKFNYKTHKEEDYIGFIAEDVPELVATKERKSINTMDVVAVLTKVVQDQQKMLQEHQETIKSLEKKIAELEKNNRDN